MAIAGEILVLPCYGLGHLLPSIELCKYLSSRNLHTTLFISSSVSSSLPSSLPHRHPLFRISEIPSSPNPPPEDSGSPGPARLNPFEQLHDQMRKGIEAFLSARPDGSPRPICAVIDVMMSWSKGLFAKFGIPTVSFFTSGACSAAMEYALWKARVDELKPGETRSLPGLPDHMSVSHSELQRRPHRPGGPMKPVGGGKFYGPPGPGAEPKWLEEVEGTIALLTNTSHDLEGPFLDYVGQQMGKPVRGVGPLLPEEYYNSAGSVLRDQDVRPKRKSSHSEEEVIQWLDSKPKGSILYISFGSELGPSEDEYPELASALEETKHAFIWAVKPGSSRGPALLDTARKDDDGYYPHGLAAKVGERGLVIRDWAPQLLILSHPSTGGFLTHCGWNSTVEAIGRGVPMLAWPIRGDQFYNAKLVVSHLEIGHMVKEGDMSKMVNKEEIVKGIEKLMGDQGAKTRAVAIRERFKGGLPSSSEAALDAFKDFLGAKTE